MANVESNRVTTPIVAAGTQAAIKTGGGVLGKLLVHVVGTTATITIYDGLTATGTVLWTWVTADGKVALDLNVRFTVGLTVVTTNTPTAEITWS